MKHFPFEIKDIQSKYKQHEMLLQTRIKQINKDKCTYSEVIHIPKKKKKRNNQKMEQENKDESHAYNLINFSR